MLEVYPVTSQPLWNKPVRIQRRSRGATAKSKQRLEELDFDPIGELVASYRKLQKEIEYQENIRTGKLVELRSDGKPRAYRAEVHLGLYDKINVISKELLRYGYGRVPEAETNTGIAPRPLIVNLTARGEQYVINDAQDDEDDDSSD
jgi:hypothetical protein